MATLKAMFKLFDGYSSTIDKITKKTDEATSKILKASGSTDKFNEKLNKTGASANSASSGLNKLIGTAITFATVIKGMNIADEFTNTSARLNLINDGMQTQLELQNKIFAAANRSKGVYADMASAISKMGLMAGESFGSNDELIAFTELIQKSFKVGGASGTEQSSAMLQLTQAMGAGKLQGDEFRSITENAPMIADAIAKYVGVSKGELKTLSSEGAITSDIIKNAMFAMSDDINAKFETMPSTFADVWNRIKNGGLQAFGPVIEKVNGLINTEGFNNFISGAITVMNVLGGAIGFLIDFTIYFWDLIEPFLVGLIGALLPGLAVGLWALVSPILTIAGAWLIANWPLILIIATIFLAVKALGSLGVTFGDVIGFIGGVLGVFYAFFANIFISMWNDVASFINFFANVFNNPIAAVQTKFLDMAVNVLGFIESLAQGIEDLLNKIPGVKVNITGALTGIKNNLSSKSSSIKDEAGLKEYVKTKDFIDYSSAYNKGFDIGTGAFDKIGGVFADFGGLTDLSGGLSNFDMSNFGSSSNPLSVEGTGKNGAIEVDMSDEDLRYMRDIAEREYVNKFSTKTLAPQISVTFGDVRETADVNQVAKRISKILKEEIETTGEV